MNLKKLAYCIALSATIHSTGALANNNFTEIVAKMKRSVVGVGLHTPISNPVNQLKGTGFVIGNGFYVATNHHVVSETLDPTIVQHHVVFDGKGQLAKIIKGVIVAYDAKRDIAILKIEEKLTPVTLAENTLQEDGTSLAFTGFPIGAVLGLYPATHRGFLAAVTPDFIPQTNSQSLSANVLNRVDSSFLIYQLDATAFPGNSGSPVYNILTGEVFAIINKVFVSESKETVLSAPSGITYAIPIKYLRALASSKNITL